MMQYEIISILNDLSYTVRFYAMETVTAADTGEDITRLAFEQTQTFKHEETDTIDTMAVKVVARAEELKAQFELLQSAKAAIRGEV